MYISQAVSLILFHSLSLISDIASTESASNTSRRSDGITLLLVVMNIPLALLHEYCTT